jgi:hypothetical protein
MTRINYLYFLVFLATFGLQGCNFGASKTMMDENIKQSLKIEIEALDEKILEAVTSNNPELFKTVMSDRLIEKSGDKIDQMIEQVSNLFTVKDYRVLNQFHVTNSKPGIGNTVFSGISGLNDYKIQYQAENKEMFISLLIPKTGIDEFLIANIYGKYPEGWKLNIIHFGQYKVNGQTAPELYIKAKEKLDKEYLVDAVNAMFLCSLVLNPADLYWKYQKEDEMKLLQEKVMSIANTKYSFPFTLEEIDTKPSILSIYPQGMHEGYFPMIEYLTSIDLEDTLSTKAENEKIHKLIGQKFHGIDKDKKFIFYKAFSQMPDNVTPVATYGFVKELK